jgi:hypothetical protein
MKVGHYLNDLRSICPVLKNVNWFSKQHLQCVSERVLLATQDS